MKKAVVYYRSGTENQEEVVKNIEMHINKIKHHFSIAGVFIDLLDGSEEFDNLIDLGLNNTDVLFVHISTPDDFDQTLLMELSKRESFDIKLF